eukprot:gene17371-biopygen5332
MHLFFRNPRPRKHGALRLHLLAGASPAASRRSSRGGGAGISFHRGAAADGPPPPRIPVAGAGSPLRGQDPLNPARARCHWRWSAAARESTQHDPADIFGKGGTLSRDTQAAHGRRRGRVGVVGSSPARIACGPSSLN